MASKIIYWTADGGGGDGSGPVATELHKWIVQQDDAELIIYGGDVYSSGTTQEFAEFFDQMGGDVSRMCETAGNHDWAIPQPRPGAGEIPTGYEDFWSSRPSQQPIDTAKQAGARYEHFRDLNGWRLIFLDTGQCKGRCQGTRKWPFTEHSQIAWLTGALGGQCQGRMLFAHHGRLSWGSHGDNPGLDDLWRLLFDAVGKPLVSLTLSGHDHNVSVYAPRDRDLQRTANPKDGIQIIVNGAGGDGQYMRTGGTRADVYPASDSAQDDPPTYCVTRIEIVDASTAHLRVLGFGAEPSSTAGPQATLFQQTYTFP
jgi:Calcineurin-like phosphoesterase